MVGLALSLLHQTIQLALEHFYQAKLVKQIYPRIIKVVTWIPPLALFITLDTDGSVLCNLGITSGWGVFGDWHGHWLLELYG